MINLPSFQYVLFGVLLACLLSCRHEPIDAEISAYPKDIARILEKNCAVSGCHNAQSAPGAGGLNLESWTSLFHGSRGGSPVIPYSPELSYLMFSVNTDSTLGPVLTPTMPYDLPPLSSQEYSTLWNWIYDGALNKNGEERFPPDPNRRKWYVGHEICDDVAIFDAESRQIMRYIDVGEDPMSVEYVFDIQISPDGKDWFVVFFGGNKYISRYSTTNDKKIADIPMDYYGWSGLAISPDGKFAFACSEHFLLMQAIDLSKNTAVGPLIGFDYPVRAPVVHPLKKQVYLAEYIDRSLIVVDYDDAGQLSNKRSIDLIQGFPSAIIGDVWPSEIFFLPDGSKYFVTCNHSNEVRVFDGGNDSLLEVIVLPASPSKMAYSIAKKRLFVSCSDDLVSWAGDPTKRGSIIMIDSETHQIEGKIYAGFQPYSIMVDDVDKILVVTNRNEDLSGPRPHHVSNCEGRNGYISLVDINTLEVISDYKPEILAGPSTISGK